MAYVRSQIGPSFHDKLLASLTKLRLNHVLKRKNPYLYKAKSVETAADLIKRLLDAYLSSQEETVFGAFLESLAIHVCSVAFDGKKSTTEGIDLEFVRDQQRYIVSIKSGPSWGNSQQIKRMESNFAQARKIAGKNVLMAINGCCYGQEARRERGNYRKLCGQDFWELITGIDNFYQQIIEPLGSDAKKRTDTFQKQYVAVINQFTLEFLNRFCLRNGHIHWNKLLEFNSGRIKPVDSSG